MFVWRKILAHGLKSLATPEIDDDNDSVSFVKYKELQIASYPATNADIETSLISC